MKILLIKPHGTIQDGHSDPPLGLLYIASVLKKENIRVDVVDGFITGYNGIVDRINHYKPDIVGITVYTAGRHNALKIVKVAKQANPEILTILGGPHPTIMWKQILANYPFVDICVLGEGEMTMLDITKDNNLNNIEGIAYRKDGSSVKRNRIKYIDNLDSIPFPAWEMVEFNKYPPRPTEGITIYNDINLTNIPRVPVIFSRGCTGHCNFCSTWWIWRHYRCRSAKNMTDELQLLNSRFNIKHFIFIDDIFSANINSAKELCREIISRNLKISWHATTRVDCVDRELLDLMKKAGCYEISYGIESASEQILKNIGKEINTEQARCAIMLTKKAGIKATCLLIIGNVGETIKTINETIDFIQKTNADGIGTVGSLWIFPGTSLYQMVKKKGLIDDQFWLGSKPYMIYNIEHNQDDLAEYRDAIFSRKKITLYGHLRRKLIYYLKGYLRRILSPRAYQALKIIKKNLLFWRCVLRFVRTYFKGNL